MGALLARHHLRLVHYHSQIHEAMGVPGLQSDAAALDAAELHFGPAAGVIEASRGFLVVGAYPADGTYDECTDTRERADFSQAHCENPETGC